jgi:hypothetical protein
MLGHGGPQIIVASHPGAFCVPFDTNEKVKHPEADVAVYEEITFVPK